MAEMRKIKSYSTAFLMSLAVHALVLFLIVIFSKASLNAQKMVVIDLTLMDPVTAGAAVASDKKASIMSKLKTKPEKAAVKRVEPEKRQKKQVAQDEKAETELKIAQDQETSQVEEKIPTVKTVALIQTTKQNFAKKDHKESERVGTSLSNTGAIEGTSLTQGDVPTENAKEGIGSGSGNTDGVMKGYLRSHLSYIKDLIQKNITYPETARREGWMGKVTVSFIIAHNGCVRDIEVLRSSGFVCLDKNAVKAVERSSPFPHPPLEARIIIPILYELH